MPAFSPPTLASETILHIGSFAVRNTMLMAWLAVATLCVLALFVRRTGYALVPGRFQAAVETVVDGLFNFFQSVIQDTKETAAFFPLICTILLFLVLGNWMGILPGIGSIFVHEVHNGEAMAVPLFRSMNADVNMTLAIALIAMISVQVFGVSMLGFKGYSGKFLVPPWKDPVGTFVGLLELVSEFSKVISFTFRLFGNIFAGEVLLVVISYLSPFLAPIPFIGLELFVGVVQGLVFSLLTAVFLKMAVTSHHADHPTPSPLPQP